MVEELLNYFFDSFVGYDDARPKRSTDGKVKRCALTCVGIHIRTGGNENVDQGWVTVAGCCLQGHVRPY